MWLNFRTQKGWSIFSLFVWVATLTGMTCVLANPYLWFDEAGQFFLALGINHWSPPFMGRKGFSDILAQNNRYLFDPVGYTLLLRLWQEAGTAAVWLRTLPFIGFLGMAATGFRLLQRAEVPQTEARLLTALFASSPLLYQYAAELRPYSYEAWGTLFALLVLYDYSPQKSGWWMVKTGFAMAFFMWMRYPFVIAAAITGVILFYKTLLGKDGFRWRNWLLYALPQILSAVLIYWICIRQQPISDQSPVYARATTLRYGWGFLLHPWTLFYHGAVLAFLLFAVFQKRFRYPVRLQKLSLFTLLLFGIWNGFSLLGNIASDPNARWAIGLNAVAMLCLFMLVAAALSRMPMRAKPLAYILLAALALYRPALMTLRWLEKDPVRFRGRVFVPELTHVANHATMPIWSGSGSTPEIKYLYEYGILRSQQKKAGYPQRFVLLNQQNEFDQLNQLPRYQKILWIDSPGRYTREGRFQSKRWGNSPVFFQLWRVR